MYRSPVPCRRRRRSPKRTDDENDEKKGKATDGDHIVIVNSDFQQSVGWLIFAFAESMFCLMMRTTWLSLLQQKLRIIKDLLKKCLASLQSSCSMRRIPKLLKSSPCSMQKGNLLVIQAWLRSQYFSHSSKSPWQKKSFPMRRYSPEQAMLFYLHFYRIFDATASVFEACQKFRSSRLHSNRLKRVVSSLLEFSPYSTLLMSQLMTKHLSASLIAWLIRYKVPMLWMQREYLAVWFLLLYLLRAYLKLIMPLFQSSMFMQQMASRWQMSAASMGKELGYSAAICSTYLQLMEALSYSLRFSLQCAINNLHLMLTLELLQAYLCLKSYRKSSNPLSSLFSMKLYAKLSLSSTTR